MNIDEMKELLILKWDYKAEDLEKLSENQIEALYNKRQKEEIKALKNPNRFFILRSMPAPKNVETKTSSKAGIIVFVAFILMLILMIAIFLYLGLSNHL